MTPQSFGTSLEVGGQACGPAGALLASYAAILALNKIPNPAANLSIVISHIQCGVFEFGDALIELFHWKAGAAIGVPGPQPVPLPW